MPHSREIDFNCINVAVKIMGVLAIADYDRLQFCSKDIQKKLCAKV